MKYTYYRNYDKMCENKEKSIKMSLNNRKIAILSEKSLAI